jgi:PKD repeat protein
MANGCTGPVTTVTVTVNSIARVSAGADFSVCEPVTIPLSGSFGGTTTSATWAVVSGTGSLSVSTVSGTTVTATYTVGAGDIGGIVVFRLTTNDPDAGGPCTAVSDDVTVNVNRKARVIAPADYTLCEPSSINLFGTLSGSSSTGLWSLITGTGSLSATSLTGSNVTAVYTPSVSDVATTLRFRLTTNDPDGFGPCVAEWDEVDIHINESAKVNAGPDAEVCENNPINLDGTTGGTTSIVTWSGGGGASQFGDVNAEDTQYTLTPSDIAAGGVTLTLTADDPDGVGSAGPCLAVSDQVFIRINKLPEVSLSGLQAGYAENDPIDSLEAFPVGGVFTGPGIIAGTNKFDPGSAPFGSITITYTYTHPTTLCVNSASRNTVVNPVTDIDFDIAPIRRDASGFPIICANSGNLQLIGYPPVSEAASASFQSQDIPSRIIKVGDEYSINTNGLPAGSYEVQYIFENAFGATDTLTKQVTVYSGPKAVITIDRTCVDQDLVFTEASTIPNNGSNGTISKYHWKLGEFGEERSIRNPVYAYEDSGNKTVELRVETDQGCFHDTTRIVRVGLEPQVDFIWKKICSGVETTEFQDVTVTSEFSSIREYEWDFGDGDILPFGPSGDPVPSGTHGGATSGTYNDPNHKYDLFRVYDVKLTVHTNDGCTSSKTNKVYILDYSIPGPTSGYFTDFEAGPGTWVPIATESDTSWVFGSPAGNEINSAGSGSNAWWTGGNTNSAADYSTYFNNEMSEVIGPCLNLENIKRPMISLNYWSDSQEGFDGAVIQFSTDGALTWETIGDADGLGINWYNSRDLSSAPGGQDNYAWSDSTSGWKNARFSLDRIPVSRRGLVVFRIAFASNDDNPNERILNGFAFDDVYIGEKKRNVLVEQFTNDSYGPSNQADLYLDNLYQSEIIDRDSADFIIMQYHIANPAYDQLNADNPVDPAARALLFGVSQPPTTIMDGIQGRYFNKDFNGATTDITANEVERRALEDPLFDMAVTFQSSDQTTLQMQVDYTYIDTVSTLTNPVMLHAALVETGVNGNTNVLRKLLLQPEGRVITRIWTEGQTESITINYPIDIPIVDPDNLYIITFVQDKNTKRILQSTITKAPSKEGTVAVGLPDDPAVAALHGLSVYPNPASHSFYFGLGQRLTADYTWRVIDQRGVTVLEGDLNRDLSEPQQVDVSKLANGIYFVAIQTSNRSVMYKKLAIVNGIRN